MTKLFTQEQELEICREYLAGSSSNDLATKYNCSGGAILKLLKRNRTPRRGGGNTPPDFNDAFFSELDTEEKAYFFGLIAADGSVCQPNKGGQKRFQLELIEQDKYLIKAFCSAIGYPVNRIRTYKRPNRSKTSKVSITSNIFCNSLEVLGIKSGKANGFPMPALDEPYMKHFLRGLFDGDGSVGDYRLTLTAGNTEILEQVKDYLVTKLKLNQLALKIYKTGPRTWTLSVNRKLERHQILQYLYADSTIKMERKARYLGDQMQKLSCEFRENPEEGNSEPSFERDFEEGATTSENVLEQNMNRHERRTTVILTPIFEIGNPNKPVEILRHEVLAVDDIV